MANQEPCNCFRCQIVRELEKAVAEGRVIVIGPPDDTEWKVGSRGQPVPVFVHDEKEKGS